jgi:hypothetical protein
MRVLGGPVWGMSEGNLGSSPLHGRAVKACPPALAAAKALL